MTTQPRTRKAVATASERVDTTDLRDNARAAAEFLKALANESRLVMLCLLAEGEKSVSELADLLGERQPTASQQLARLRAERFVTARRDGQQIFYSLASKQVRDIIAALHGTFCQPASPVDGAAQSRSNPGKVARKAARKTVDKTVHKTARKAAPGRRSVDAN